MSNLRGYRCIRCGGTMDASFDGYVCAACEGNLELFYDYERAGVQLKADLAGEMKERMDMFRYRAFLPIESIELAPSLRIGMTPIYASSSLGEKAGVDRLYFKDESGNPSASFKDRASAVVITRAREQGVTVVAGASTGNAGSSMACLSAHVGMPCVVFVPHAAPVAKLTQLMIFGACVIAVNGSYDDAYDLCFQVTEQTGWLNRNTGYNPVTREGKKTASFEIWEQFDRSCPDWVVVSSGDGNILGGIWKGFKDLKKAGLIDAVPRLLCAQSEKSAAITRTVRNIDPTQPTSWEKVCVETVQASTIADSIAVDIPRDGLAAVRAVIESNGAAVAVSDEAILVAQRELAAEEGLFVEPAAATAWACAKHAVETGVIAPSASILCVLTGSGLKDVVTAQRSVGNPVQIAPTLDEAMTVLTSLMPDKF